MSPCESDTDAVDMAALHPGEHISLPIADTDIGGLAGVFLLGDVEIAVLAAGDVVRAAHTSRISDLLERAVTVAGHEGLAKTAESVVIALGIPIGTQEQNV